MKVSPVSIDFSVNLPFIATVVAAMLFQAATNARDDTRVSAIESSTKDLPEMRSSIARMDERSKWSSDAIARIERRIEEGAR